MTVALFTVPNVLSLLRVPLAAGFLLTSSTSFRIAILVAAAATDYADGWWARARRSQTTKLGAILDPVTDKLFMLTALGTLVVEGALTIAQLLVLLLRDIYVSIGALLLLVLRKPLRIKARFSGKVVTTLQLAGILTVLLLPRATTPLLIAIAVTSLWAMVDYTVTAVRALRAAPERR